MNWYVRVTMRLSPDKLCNQFSLTKVHSARPRDLKRHTLYLAGAQNSISLYRIFLRFDQLLVQVPLPTFWK